MVIFSYKCKLRTLSETKDILGTFCSSISMYIAQKQSKMEEDKKINVLSYYKITNLELYMTTQNIMI